MSAVLVESSDDDSLSVPADSLLNLSRSPESASIVTSVESSDDSGSLEVIAPSASGELVVSVGKDLAVLSLSDVSSNNSGSSE